MSPNLRPAFTQHPEAYLIAPRVSHDRARYGAAIERFASPGPSPIDRLLRVVAVLILLVAAALLVGCDRPYEWTNAPGDHTCSAEQHEKVEHETDWCAKNAGFNNIYCYSTAIMRNCAKRAKP